MNKVNVNKVVDYANLLKENERLNNIINALKQNELYCVDYETEEDIEKGNKIYIPFDLEKFIQELDRRINV